MNTYKIVAFDKQTGSLSIIFDERMAPLNVDIPLDEQGNYITGEELNTYINGFIPTWHLDRVSKIASGIPNEAAIEALVEPIIPVDATDPVQAAQVINDTLTWQQEESEKQIAKVLVKYGLITEDQVV